MDTNQLLVVASFAMVAIAIARLILDRRDRGG